MCTPKIEPTISTRNIEREYISVLSQQIKCFLTGACLILAWYYLYEIPENHGMFFYEMM